MKTILIDVFFPFFDNYLINYCNYINKIEKFIITNLIRVIN